MSFFPNLISAGSDSVNTINVSYEENVPILPAIGYYSNKKTRGLNEKTVVDNHTDNVNNVCNRTDWVCDYVSIGKSDSNKTVPNNLYTNPSREELQYIFTLKRVSDTLYSEDISFIDIENFSFCDMPNILVRLGYQYDSNSGNNDFYKKTYNAAKYGFTGANETNYIVLVKNTPSATPSNNQSTYNACQTVMSRSRLYDVGELMTGGLYYGIKDLFVKMKTIRPVLLVVLLVSVYLLVNGTVSSADIGLNITSQIAARGNSSTMFWIGVFAGILMPAIFAMISASDALKKSSKLVGGYNISNSPYGTLESGSEADKNQLAESTTLVGLLIVIAYILIAGIYYIASSRKRSPYFKVMTIIIGLLLLTVTAFILFYWSPLVSASDSKDEVYGVSHPLKVWTKTTDQKEISDVRSNKNVDRALRRFLSIYAITILVVTLIYLRQSSKPLSGFNLGGSVMEGIMASCAILSLPILWIFNWYIGIKFFIGYPMLLLIVRYIRYAIYYFIRMAYISNPSALASYPALRQEFAHPENYTAPWDLMGVTAFKYMLKLMGRKPSYSDMMVDPRNSSKDIASNSYTTGHVMRMAMKGTPGPYDSYHTGTVGALTIAIFGFLVFYVIGKDNAL